MYLLDFAIQIAGRRVELLALPLVHVRPDRVAVSAVKLCIDVDQSLDVVVSGWDVAQAVRGITQSRAIDHRALARLEVVHIYPEERRRVTPETRSQTGLRLALGRDHDEDSAGDSVRVRRSGERDLKLQ